jgi:putative YphP/YqiW family bacilliredoxin
MLIQRYPEPFIAPMREELTRVGFEELRTPEAVDQAVARKGTTLVVVNSVCGCAAGKARPGIALSLKPGVRPDHLATVFAGADVEATDRARAYFAPYPPSSPAVALLKDGKLVYMMERRDIESQPAQAIAERLHAAYEKFCRADLPDLSERKQVEG